jgi:hypothetical protein
MKKSEKNHCCDWSRVDLAVFDPPKEERPEELIRLPELVEPPKEEDERVEEIFERVPEKEPLEPIKEEEDIRRPIDVEEGVRPVEPVKEEEDIRRPIEEEVRPTEPVREEEDIRQPIDLEEVETRPVEDLRPNVPVRDEEDARPIEIDVRPIEEEERVEAYESFVDFTVEIPIVADSTCQRVRDIFTKKMEAALGGGTALMDLSVLDEVFTQSFSKASEGREREPRVGSARRQLQSREVDPRLVVEELEKVDDSRRIIEEPEKVDEFRIVEDLARDIDAELEKALAEVEKLPEDLNRDLERLEDPLADHVINDREPEKDPELLREEEARIEDDLRRPDEVRPEDERVREDEYRLEDERVREEFEVLHNELKDVLGDDWERLEGALADFERLDKEVIDTAEIERAMTEGFDQLEMRFNDEQRPAVEYERVVNGDFRSLKELEESLMRRFEEELKRAQSERFEGDLREVVEEYGRAVED